MRIKNSADFGKLIRQTRLAHGLRQIDVAGFSGCGERFIVDLENGKPTCQFEKAMHIAHSLGIRIDAIGPPEKKPAKSD